MLKPRANVINKHLIDLRTRVAPAVAVHVTIARNKRIDILRRVSRPEPDPEDPMFQPDPPQSGEEFTQSRQDQVRVRAALEHLPPEQVEIVRLSFFDSLTHSEIAERLSLPLGTVKSRLRLSFRKIRSALGDER